MPLKATAGLVQQGFHGWSFRPHENLVVMENNSFRKLLPDEKITHSSPYYFLLNR
jgi:hypothetical protein